MSKSHGWLASPLSRRGVLVGGSGALAGIAAGALWRPESAQASNSRREDDVATILEFNVMAPVMGPFVGGTNPVRGIAGGGRPWKITSARGELKANGKIEVSVRGLVLVATGVNPVANFKAIVSCLTSDGASGVATVNLSTALFPATSTGDADIEDTVSLPSPCIAPIVFVGPGVWFAATGM